MTTLPNFEQIGQSLVQQYYQFLDGNQKEQLVQLYHPQACMTFEENKTQGHDGIKDILMNKLRFNSIQHAVTKVDCQPTLDGGVVVLVTGRLKTDDDPPHAYSQVFNVKGDGSGNLFIVNDLFRLSIHDSA